MVSNRFEKIDIYMECDWYLYSPQMQRILPIMILNADEIVIKGYGNVLLTRETFKMVNDEIIYVWLIWIYFLRFSLFLGDKRSIFLFYGTS